MKKKQHTLSSGRNNLTQKLEVLTSYLEKDPGNVLSQAQTLLNTHPDHIELLAIAGNSARLVGQEDLALTYVNLALDQEPKHLPALRVRAQLEIDKGNNGEAIPFLIQAILAHPRDTKTFVLLSHALLKLKRFDEFFSYFYDLPEEVKNNSAVLNNYGQALLEVARVEEGLIAFRKSIQKDPSYYVPRANLIVGLHYSPNHTPEDILKECRLFQKRLLPSRSIRRAKATRALPNKKLRIGMISGGFCAHPVGSMITHGLLHVKRDQIEFYAYSTNRRTDHITEKIKNICAKWDYVDRLSDTELDALIRKDEVDILFDLSGFNDNSRMKTIMMEPAPIIIKWVGGLISSTGVDAIDYLLSDRIETPPDVDCLYTEKIIRLPDDYICFEPPLYTPPVNELPAKKNGYVTFGCFNNASKINNDLLEKWADILNQLPTSRLFLKSHAFSSTDLRERVIGFFDQQGIKKDRIRLEGASPHRQLLACYNEVDVALDPWPYSGGLTTCEALIMGVPVITFPGPTFAGRHSATHLFNAGMPELIANSWEQYTQLAIGLATDLDNLAIIRENLRFTVLQSPLCNANRFSQSFTHAMRAIWQRYCAGKEPQALVIGNDLVPYFADEISPVELLHAESDDEQKARRRSEDKRDEEFRFSIDGRIIMVDNGTLFTNNENFLRLKSLNAFQFTIFDPAGAIKKQALPIDTDFSVQHFPFHGLGDGEKITLYATLDAGLSSTLAPLGYSSQKKDETLTATSIVAEAPIFSVKADSIGGLTHVDWLLLSGRHSIMPVLNPENTLTTKALIVEIDFSSEIRYEGQPDTDILISHMKSLRFECHELTVDKQDFDITPIKKTGPVLLFVPNKNRLKELSENELERLAFILHSAYGSYELTYNVFSIFSPERAMAYRNTMGMKGGFHETKITIPSNPTKLKKSSSAMGAVDLKNEGDPFINYDWELNSKINVVDIGANPIDGTPPYAAMLSTGNISLIGFEPQKDALKRLEQMKGENETYFPYAIGDGKETTLYICRASGMTSTLEPNFETLNHFQGYPIWAEVIKKERIKTRRLNDIKAISDIDWLKIDIQGGELRVFENGDEKLKNTLVIQTEANFIHLYKNQPLFADIDQWMRSSGFMLHTLLEVRKRLYAPMTIGGQIHNGINQITTADAVYIPSTERLSSLNSERRTKLAYILYKAYGSVDLAYRIMSLTPKKEEASVENVSSEIDWMLKSIRAE